MKNNKDLQRLLMSLDGKSYGAYKEIKGSYSFKDYVIEIQHVQGDPFASPSKVRVFMPINVAGVPNTFIDSKNKCIAAADFLTRVFAENIEKLYNGVRGSGKSGMICIARPSTQILERTSVMIDAKQIELRCEVGLPAAGRRVLGKAAAYILCEALPKIVEASLYYKNIDGSKLQAQVELMEDQAFIRKELINRDLITFIANGSILPRKSGISELPLKKGVPFRSPVHLEVEMNLPYRGKVKGLGIPKGITLIVGGGYHGKSTLLQAIEKGVYNHIPSDGRELVITRDDAMKIRAEDGRSVAKVNISPFINNLPNGKDTVKFSTENASGSTSQATNVMEALEAGSKVLLIDEDTSATNFMIRDGRMQKLVAKEKEPITPFIDKVAQLKLQKDVSTIMVVGGSGDYFDVAEHIIMLDSYHLEDVTARAKEIASEIGETRAAQNDKAFGEITHRILMKNSFPKGDKDSKIKVRSLDTISYGDENIDLSYVEQLVEINQTNALGAILDYMVKNIIDDNHTLEECVSIFEAKVKKEGITVLSSCSGYSGNLAMPRAYEVCCMINRYRKLRIK
ncbi:ABC-ATPase domain-containing protein [Cellulosilyticum ruminicola]|uniref:ABC-ATPase domain-containing protein n=1 Tax=Cellulosilyticum ruminicola TaxID=425254 RepID=UPI0006D24A13|nr:ABC-ATPase domain-containing protein [Cellulosilyticum ruminicola]